MSHGRTSFGRFVWYELMSTAPEPSADFYTSLFGWGTQPMEVEGMDMPYTMFTRNGEPFAGLMQLPPEAQAAGAPTHWLGYVGVADVDAIAEKATAAGGTLLVPPRDIPNAGRFCVFQDPFGAALSVWQSASDQDATLPGQEAETGQFCWHEVYTTDLEGAFSFYAGLFGWTEMDRMDMGEAGPYILYGSNGHMLGGMMRKPDEMPVTCWHYYVQVDDVPDIIEKATSLGANLMHGPIDVPGGAVATLVDPQGGAFATHATVAAPTT